MVDLLGGTWALQHSHRVCHVQPAVSVNLVLLQVCCLSLPCTIPQSPQTLNSKLNNQDRVCLLCLSVSVPLPAGCCLL